MYKKITEITCLDSYSHFLFQLLYHYFDRFLSLLLFCLLCHQNSDWPLCLFPFHLLYHQSCLRVHCCLHPFFLLLYHQSYLRVHCCPHLFSLQVAVQENLSHCKQKYLNKDPPKQENLRFTPLSDSDLRFFRWAVIKNYALLIES